MTASCDTSQHRVTMSTIVSIDRLAAQCTRFALTILCAVGCKEHDDHSVIRYGRYWSVNWHVYYRGGVTNKVTAAQVCCSQLYLSLSLLPNPQRRSALASLHDWSFHNARCAAASRPIRNRDNASSAPSSRPEGLNRGLLAPRMLLDQVLLYAPGYICLRACAGMRQRPQDR